MTSRRDVPHDGICLVTLSDNADHQTTVFSMFQELYGRYNVYCVSREDPKAANAPHTDSNAYVKCPSRPGIAKGTFNIPGILRIIDIVKQANCRTVYFESVHLWNAPIMLVLGKRFHRVQTIHDVIPHDGSKAVYWCQRLLCALADEVVLKSDVFLERACSDYHLDRDEVTVFPVWRDYPEYTEPQNSGRMLFFGRMKRYKGLDNIAHIVRKLESLQFDVVGAPDEDGRLVIDTIRNLPNVRIVDREVTAAEMADFFCQADWVVLPYESASQSGVIIDAYKYSRPVVAFNVGGISEQVDNGETGLLIEGGNLEAFENALKQAAKTSAGTLRDIAHKAYEFGVSRYSAKGLAESFVDTFVRKASV